MELYLEQLEAGQRPDRARFLADFPDIAEELAGQLEALEFLHFTAPQLAEAEDVTAEQGLSGRATLGDFRLIKPIGRGGMGIVYEAEQLSLGRRVAVKVLPFAAMLDSRQLKRFHNEARAAATLEHPHIVPIYFVGQDRGVHFFAMQLIEGQSLAQVIQEMRTNGQPSGRTSTDSGSQLLQSQSAESHISSPNDNDSGDQTVTQRIDKEILTHPSRVRTSADRREFYRTVAILGAQAAEALQHAHEHGIIHRDIKPGNLLVDWSGKLRVADFGLARLDAHESMTAEGDILGTLAYMSPEQMSAEVTTDARSDVYSLGATLYELLTRQRPFFRHGKVHKPSTLLPADVPPLNRFDPHVPVDLQTIVLKAMSQEPADRYATAQALAADLRSFAVGGNISARPPSPTERGLRWARRHPRIFVTGSLLGLTLLMVLGLSTLLVYRANLNSRDALALSRQHAEQVEALLYLSDMERAFQAWESRRVWQVVSVLGQQIPEAGATDRRGVEWYLLNALTQPLQASLVGRHRGSANQLAVFPDGKRVASVGDDQQLRIWDIDSGDALATIGMRNSSVEALFSVAVSPDGKTVATGSDVVQLWEADTGNLIRKLTSFDYNVQSMAFSPDGQRLAAASRYDRIRVLDLSGKLLGEVEDGARHESLEFTHNGERLLVPCRQAGSENVVGLVREWNADLSRVLAEFRVEDPSTYPNYTLATISPDGKFCALSIRNVPNSTCLVDAETGNVLLRLPIQRDEINATAISPDGKFLSAAFNDGTVEYWLLERLSSGEFVMPEQTHTLRAHDGKVNSLKFAGPNRLVSCGADGTVKAWQLDRSNTPIRAGGSSGFGLAASPDGKFVAYGDHVGIQFLSAAGGEVQETIALANCNDGDLAFSNDGRFVAGLSGQRLSVMYRGPDGPSRQDLVVNGRPACLNFSPTSTELAAVTSSGVLAVWDLKTMSAIKELNLSAQATGTHSYCCYSPDGHFLLVAGDFGELVIVETANYTVVRRISLTSYCVHIVFSPTGEFLATAHADAVIRIWDWPNCKKRSELVGHGAGVSRLAFSPDGRTLASNSGDKTTRLWSPAEGRSFGIPYHHATQPSGIAFSPDGKFLYVGRTKQDSYLPGILIFPCHATSTK